MKSLYAFLKQQLTVTHIYSIPVRIDLRWLIVFAALIWFSSIGIPDSLVKVYYYKFLFGSLAILAFFFSLLFHEFFHILIAKREKIEVLEILLHPFGGLARLRREPDKSKSELYFAIAGPISSFLIALLFLGLWAFSNSFNENIFTPLFFIVFLLNLLLAIFNLFPGYPLDGGRVLRSYLWRRGTSLNDATILAGKIGMIIAGVLIFFGIAIILVSRDFVTGLWTILVGLFLLDAAYSIINKVDTFEGLIAENIMELPFSVKPEITVKEFVETILPRRRQTVFPIAENKQLYGFMLLDDLKKKLPKDKWDTTLIKDVMRPIQEDHFVETSTSAIEAKELLRINKIGVLGVLDAKGNFVGFVRRGRIRHRN